MKRRVKTYYLGGEAVPQVASDKDQVTVIVRDSGRRYRKDGIVTAPRKPRKTKAP